MYIIEFQKRGLPHVHILIWLHPDHKYLTTTDINSIISAEISDQNTDPIGYATVSKFMMHGPCGLSKPEAPYMVKGRCSKYFPKEYKTETVITIEGFPIYRRRDTNLSVLKAGIQLDNIFVVPHNLRLIIKYQAHINVEWCNKSRLIKYLFKYINKGPDRAAVVIENNVDRDGSSSTRHYKNVDEIKQYLDCRYLSAYEAVWRLFEFDIHFRQPSVERLSIHLPMMNNIIYHSSQSLVSVLNHPDIQKTMFSEWMNTNLTCADARQLTYAEFPTKWVWHQKDKFWSRRKHGYRIGRIVYIHPNVVELYFLRILLNVVKGPKNYTEIRTVDNIVHETFRSACNALGLLNDDKEWREALEEASHWSSSAGLKQLFTTIIIYCEVADPPKLWDEYWELFHID